MGFGLPKAIEVALGTGWIEDAIEEAMVRGATALVGMIAAPLSCVPGVSQAVDGVMAAATAAAGALASLIPNLNLDFSTPSMELLSPTKLFCTTLVKSPGFDGSECSQEQSSHDSQDASRCYCRLLDGLDSHPLEHFHLMSVLFRIRVVSPTTCSNASARVVSESSLPRESKA